MKRIPSRLSPLSFALWAACWLAPRVAAACPTCYASTGERVMSSYLLSAAIMTLLPFTMIGIAISVALHLRRQGRALAQSSDPVSADH